MNDNNLKAPLLKTAAILVTAIIFFCFVASGDNTLTGSLWAIISGVFYTVVFIIGLAVSVLFCIGCLIGIFLAAVYAVSRDQGSSMYEGLKEKIQNLQFCSGLDKCTINKPKIVKTVKTVKPEEPKPEKSDLQSKLTSLENEIALLKEKESKNAAKLEELIKEREEKE